jgi:hypothetical protein
MTWRLTMRVNGRVERQTFAEAADAFAGLEERCRAIVTGSRREAIKVAKRTYDPIVQVQARAELRGPGGAAGGVDVRGDGSTEAFTGRFRRRLVDVRKGEDAYAALRRALSSTSVAP